MNVSARQVYVKLNGDMLAWQHVTEDANTLIITLPENSSDFIENVLLQLQSFDEVWVAKGIYLNSNKLTLRNDENTGLRYGNISIYGGFEGTETSPDQRILHDKDGNGIVEPWEFLHETNFRGAGNSADHASSFQLIHLDSNSILDGVTISDNYHTASRDASGGTVGTSGTIRNCIIRDVTTAFGGGTIYGGGLYVAGGTVDACLFETCASIVGDDTSENFCYGGAIQAYGIGDNTAGTPTGSIKNSVIRNCKAGQGANKGRGGAIFGKGGLIVENCVMYNNAATLNGGAFYFHNNGDANKHVNRIIGCTVVNNCSLDAGSQAACFAECDYAEFYNSVFWGNSASDYPQSAADYNNTVRFRNNNTSVTAYPFIDGFAYNGTIRNEDANKNASFNPILLTNPIVGGYDVEAGGVDPKFSNPSPFQGLALNAADLADIRIANFTLLEGSPLIDAGVNAPTNKNNGYDIASLAASFLEKDIIGNNRNQKEKFDIGAYQYGSQSGVNTLENTKYTLYVNNGCLSVLGLDAPATVNVYSVNGVLLYRTISNTTEVEIPLDHKGLYVVSLHINNTNYNKKVIY